jgi:aspartate kinase
MKFGGTSVADAQCIRQVVDILEKHYKAGDKLAVVVSAQRGVTDQLIDICGKLPTAKDDSAIAPLIQSLGKRHITTLEGAAPSFVAETGQEIEERLISLSHQPFWTVVKLASSPRRNMGNPQHFRKVMNE